MRCLVCWWTASSVCVLCWPVMVVCACVWFEIIANRWDSHGCCMAAIWLHGAWLLQWLLLLVASFHPLASLHSSLLVDHPLITTPPDHSTRSDDGTNTMASAAASSSDRDRALIEDLGLALVREYLAKRKYKQTLEMLASELVNRRQHTAVQRRAASLSRRRPILTVTARLWACSDRSAVQARSNHDHCTGQESRHHQVREQEQQGR